MKKRFLASLLALGMLLSMATGAAFAEGEPEAEFEGKQYSTLAEALGVALNNRVTLLKDITLTGSVTWSSVNIETKGHTITVPSGATLTIDNNGWRGESGIENNDTNDAPLLIVEEGGTLNIEGGTFFSEGSELIKIFGTAEISDGEFSSSLIATPDNKKDGRGIVVVNGERAQLTMTGGSISVRSTSSVPGYALHGLTLFNGATAILGKKDAAEEYDGPSIVGNYTAIGMNNLMAGSGINLTIYSGYYSTCDASGNEKYNAVIYMPADITANIEGGQFIADFGSVPSDGGSYIFSVPYKTNTSLTISGGDFQSIRSTIFRMAAQTAPGGNTPNISITGGKFKEQKPADGNQYSVTGYIEPGSESNVTVTGQPIRATGLEVTIRAYPLPDKGKYDIFVKDSSNNEVTDHLYYRISNSSTYLPYLGDDIPQDEGWKPLTGTTLSNVPDEKCIAVLQTDDRGKIVKAGISSWTDNGVIDDLTVSAARNEDKNEITLTVTGDTPFGHTRYYRLNTADPTPPTSDAFTSTGWTALPTGSVPVTDNDKYVEVMEVRNHDKKITHWGKAEVPAKSGSTTGIQNLTVTTQRDLDDEEKITLSVTPSAAADSKRYYRLDTADPVKPAADTFTESEWTGLLTGSVAVTESHKYVEVVEVKDGKITHWGMKEIPAKGGTTTGIQNLTVTAQRDPDDEEKITLSVTPPAAADSKRYYRLCGDDPQKPMPDAFAVSEWTELTTGSGLVTGDYGYVEVAEVKDGKITHWGKASIPAKGGTTTDPDIKDLTVAAQRDPNNKENITLSVTQSAAADSKRYYQLHETDPAEPTNDTFDNSDNKWKELTAESFKISDSLKYVEVVEVKDDKITHWGKASIPAKDGTSTDTGVDIKNLSVTAKRETDNKITLTVTGDKAEGSTRYYRLSETDPAKPTSDTFTKSEWTELPSGSFTVTDNQKYAAVAEVKDNKITHWGKASIPAKTDTPTTPDKPTTPTTYYWISTYSNSRGTVSVPSLAEPGETVWVRLHPRSGYYADGLSVTDSSGYRLNVYYQGSDYYTFTMPSSNVWLDPYFVSSYVSSYVSGPSYNYTAPVTTTPTSTYRPSYNSGTATYRDVPASAWYYNAVQYVYRYDLMSGTGSGSFSPNQTTTRAMVASMLYGMAGRPAASGGKFDDVDSGAWYADAVVWAARNGIASGYGGFFRPNEAVSREQMALMMYNYAKLQGLDVSAQSGLSSFRDAGRVSPQALKAVRWANAVGLLNGVNGGQLDPKGSVTRAQIASILMNFRENIA